MKKDQYFNLEVNFLSNDNIVRMMMELDAAQSLGIYMMLLTHLRKADNYEASCCPLCMGAFARMYDLDAGVLQRVLREFDLFVLDEERQMFRSPYLDRVMARLEERRMINVANGKKGGRPKRMESTPETPMDKAKNRIKTRRVEKRREELLLLSKTTTVVTKKRQRKKILPPLLTDFRSFLHRRIGDSCPYSRFFRGRCWWIRWPNRKVTWSRWLCTPVWANFSWSGRRR